MEELRVGDRVQNVHSKTTGTIIYIIEGTQGLKGAYKYLVEYDVDISGHDGFGRGKQGHCWYEKESEIQILQHTESGNNMNLLEKICKELNVEVDKEWLAENGHTYRITKLGNLEYTKNGEHITDWDWQEVLTGKIKPSKIKTDWKPEFGEMYFVPDILDKESSYIEYAWQGYELDRTWERRGLVFSTKGEAIEAANKMINATKGGLK